MLRYYDRDSATRCKACAGLADVEGEPCSACEGRGVVGDWSIEDLIAVGYERAAEGLAGDDPPGGARLAAELAVLLEGVMVAGGQAYVAGSVQFYPATLKAQMTGVQPRALGWGVPDGG